MTQIAGVGASPAPVRRAQGSWWSRPWGMVVGAVCGFLTYWIGAAIAAAPDLITMPRSGLPQEFSRPFWTATAWEIVIILIGAVIGGVVARYRWRVVGVMGYVGLLSLIAGYLVYSLTVSIPRVPESERWLSYILLGAEVGGLSLIVVFSFYSLDAATRKRWERSSENRPYDASLRPFVACQVPVFNEPYEMVQQTVAHLMAQDYPRDRVRVIVADDSTDPETSRPLADYCAQVGAHYVRRPDRRGFKAGALNHVTRHLPSEYELVAIIDADYWVRPDYLKSIVGHFIDPAISFVQTPQDYRNRDESFLTRQYARAESYFYHAIMPSRNEQNAIIFCGTMGILRRYALEQIGGFAEDQICEDAEVSVRLAAAGWDSLYVDKSYGEGLMPAVFDAYKKQFHRWAFGNVRILFTRTGLILRSKMTVRQKFDFMVSNLHWFDGFFVTAIAFILLYLGLGPIFGYDAVTHHQRELVLLALIPVFLLMDGISRLHLVLRRNGPMRLRDSVKVQGMWFAIKFTNMAAVVKCMLGFRSPFIRTPKDPGSRLGRFRSFFRATRVAPWETLIGLALLGTAGFNLYHAALDWQEPGRMLLPAWLGLYALFFLCAPIYAYLSYRTLRPMRYAPIAAAKRARAGPRSAKG